MAHLIHFLIIWLESRVGGGRASPSGFPPPCLLNGTAALKHQCFSEHFWIFSFLEVKHTPMIRVCVCINLSWRVEIFSPFNSFLSYWNLLCLNWKTNQNSSRSALWEYCIPPKKQGLIVPFEAKKTDTYIIFLGICNSKILFHLTGALKKIILHIQAELEKYFYLQE